MKYLEKPENIEQNYKIIPDGRYDALVTTSNGLLLCVALLSLLQCCVYAPRSTAALGCAASVAEMLLRVSSQARGTDVEHVADVRPVTTTAQKTEPPVPSYLLLLVQTKAKESIPKKQLFPKGENP